ncbi:ADP-ribosylglycohydrolase family protein [Phycicoccus endophyticus]|uniref:ADP-ribosylglycohydrolase family protein n=1 Tax=Phycicoccus endophyticus TaxID=1690220 RepID=A0A7G9R6A0_9MICO|nr:ADP-ribosylglycohydrolase family protein [Phycicoccus endophyticus]QNN51125.1 ADP-ribosylglycohydrolase family protein [Phycicoccus endophyticus]
MARPEEAHVAERLAAAWTGRIAGCNLGKPVEQAAFWTVERIRDYLQRLDAYPLRDYLPVMDPMPEEFRLLDNWTETTRGNVHGSARDDDIDYTILALHMLEEHGSGLTADLVGQYWRDLFPIAKVYTAERAAYRNLVRGLPVPETARFRNPYREWIGAAIRGDVFGYVHPGDPGAAARAAYQDARLSHVRNGVYGEMWVAALVATSFLTRDASEALTTALGVVPPGSRFAEAQRLVLDLRRAGATWEEALERVRTEYAFTPWVHAVNNAAVVSLALLWADGDWATATGSAVMSGWDTDSNGATVGSVAGVLWGSASIPERFSDPLEDRTRSALFGYDHSRISDLAQRTVRLGHELAGR